eukprot:1353345-Prymnesium_polylepis.1
MSSAPSSRSSARVLVREALELGHRGRALAWQAHVAVGVARRLGAALIGREVRGRREARVHPEVDAVPVPHGALDREAALAGRLQDVELSHDHAHGGADLARDGRVGHHAEAQPERVERRDRLQREPVEADTEPLHEPQLRQKVAEQLRVLAQHRELHPRVVALLEAEPRPVAAHAGHLPLGDQREERRVVEQRCAQGRHVLRRRHVRKLPRLSACTCCARLTRLTGLEPPTTPLVWWLTSAPWSILIGVGLRPSSSSKVDI